MQSGGPALALVAVTLIGGALPAAAQERYWPCLACHERQINPAAFATSAHGLISCADCHLDVPLNPHARQSQPSKPEVVVLAARLRGKGKEPVALASCARRDCHADVFAQVRDSVHGAAVLEGKPDLARAAAYCLDCHGSPHRIDILSRGEERKVKNAYLCAKCHADPKFIGQYGLNPHVWSTYQQSMHGRKARLASGGAASCSDCHGCHLIFRKADSRSTVNPANVAATCGACHKGAKPGFATTFSHQPNTWKGFAIGWLAEHFFAYLTFGTIGFVALHVMLDISAQLRKGLRRGRRKERE
ncbi:MAG: hypothetical protein HY906_25365 [Deltaproteobacteria bacterium]|nr:hypothetical protein [Deltaproteobacteria bacterium]